VEGLHYRWGWRRIWLSGSVARPRLGQKIEFIPPHCDPTMNLHDRIYAAAAVVEPLEDQ